MGWSVLPSYRQGHGHSIKWRAGECAGGPTCCPVKSKSERGWLKMTMFLLALTRSSTNNVWLAGHESFLQEWSSSAWTRRRERREWGCWYILHTSHWRVLVRMVRDMIPALFSLLGPLPLFTTSLEMVGKKCEGIQWEIRAAGKECLSHKVHSYTLVSPQLTQTSIATIHRHTYLHQILIGPHGHPANRSGKKALKASWINMQIKHINHSYMVSYQEYCYGQSY